MTLTALTDTLQSLELNAKSTFADDPFTSARALLSQNKLEPIDDSLGSDLLSSLGNSSGYSIAHIPKPPVGAAELKTQVMGQLESLHNINMDALTAAIPSAPGADAFQAQDLAGIQQSMGDLTTSIVGNSDFGGLSVPASATSISEEFDAFIRGASAFPSRLLNALIQAFKALLEKLKHPDKWLDELSETVLTDIFVEQIKGVATALPPVAMRQGAKAIQARANAALELAEMIKGLNRRTATEADLEQQREKTRRIELFLDDCDRTLANATLRVNGFDIQDFIQLLKTMPDDAGSEIKAFSQIFDPITNFVEGLDERMAEITNQLGSLIDKLKDLIDQGIDKVQAIADRIVSFIKEKLAAAQKALEQMETYIGDVTKSIQEFIKSAGKQVEGIVAQAKQAINQVAETAENGIKSLAETVKSQTEKVRQSIEQINGNIDQHLNDEELKRKIRKLLGQVTDQLDREEVQQAIGAADSSIDKMAKALEQISLKSTFDLTVTKSRSLESDFRAIDVAKLGTAQKTALGVGKKILESVDVPGIVNPKLKEAFEDVLEPVLNIVDQVQQEVDQVKLQVQSFEPGTLLKDFLRPHISSFVEALNQYRPSELLKGIKALYDKILKSLHQLDPNQLVAMLEGLYQQIAKMAEALSPEGLIKLLENQTRKIQDLLGELPIGQLIDRIQSALGSVEKLFAGLGLDEMLAPGFWNDLKEIFSLDLKQPLQKLDEIKATIDQRVGNIAEEKLRRAIDDLRNAVKVFSENPKKDYAEAKETLSGTWQEHGDALIALGEENFEGLNPDFQPGSRTDFYYEDLVGRVNLLRQRLLDEESVGKLTKIHDDWQEKLDLVHDGGRRSNEGKRLIPDNGEDIKAALASDDELIAGFKSILPDQIESQFIAPVRNILTLLNGILTKPKAILEKIEEVIQALLEAPGRIVEILTEQTDRLRHDLTATISALSAAVGRVIGRVTDTLQLTYQEVDKVLRSLRPTTLLNTFYISDLKPGGLQFLLNKLKADNRDAMADLLWKELEASQRALLAGGGLNEEAIVGVLNKVLTTNTIYPAINLLNGELPAYGKELAEKGASLSEDERLRLNRIALETEYGEALVLSMQSVFPFFMETLKDLYPEAIIQALDQTHAKIVAVVRNLPQNIGAAVQDAYIALMDKFEELIGARIDRIFLELKKPLWRLQRDLGVGLEDISGSYRRLLSAVPV